MAKSKIITRGTVHLMRDGERVTLRAGDKVPDWAVITNPNVIGDAPDETRQAPVTTTSTPATPPVTTTVNSGDTATVSSEPSVKELRALAKTLGVSGAGSKADIAARIAEKQEAPVVDAAAEADSDRAALEERARAAGHEVDENTTDDELEALLEQ